MFRIRNKNISVQNCNCDKKCKRAVNFYTELRRNFVTVENKSNYDVTGQKKGEFWKEGSEEEEGSRLQFRRVWESLH